VMWGKDNEVRDMLKASLAELGKVNTKADFGACVQNNLNPLLEEIEGMVFKEENILFPTSLEKLAPEDWVEILRESDDIGYIFIQKPAETEVLMKNLTSALQEEPVLQDGTIILPTGTIQPNELMYLLNTLPVDLTFVDRDDTVRYFTEGRDRIFRRTKSVIGRKVQNCHPPQSVDVVEKILALFKDGKKDSYEFWINLHGRLIYIRYFAVRDRDRKYLGTVEVTQDITEIKRLEGEKRLVDERA
jgi:PAS domain S-box-containing protein